MEHMYYVSPDAQVGSNVRLGRFVVVEEDSPLAPC